MPCRDREVLIGMMGVIFSEGTPPQEWEKIRVQFYPGPSESDQKSCVVLTDFYNSFKLQQI